jgi:hypothetical protein
MPEIDFGGGGAGSSFTAQNISSDTTLSTFDLAFVDASGGARTIMMPSSPSDGDAVQIVAVDTSGGNVIFAANSGQSLSGLPNLQNAGEGAVFRYRASDSTWYGTTADVLDRLYDTVNDAVTSQVGTSSNRQDVYAGAIDGQSVFLDQAGVKAYQPRDLITTQEQTITADPAGDAITVTVQGTDHDVWVPDIPQIVAHQQFFDIPNGDYSDISIFIPSFTVADQTLAESSLDGAVHGVHLQGDNTTPTNVTFQSCNATGAVGGQSPKIDGIQFTGADPFSDEDVSVIFYGCSHPSIDDCSFAGSTATNGIIPFSSSVSVEGSNTGATNLGADDLTNGVLPKHGGEVFEVNGGMTGTVTGHVARAPNGVVYLNGADGDATGGTGRAFVPDNGAGRVEDANTGEVLAPAPTFVKAGADNTKTISADFTAYTLGQIKHEQGANVDLANDQIVITKDGKYRLTFQPFVFDFASDTTVAARIKVNGTVVAEAEQLASSLGACGYSISTQRQLNDGDAITADLRSPDADGTLVNQLSKTWLEVEQVA